MFQSSTQRKSANEIHMCKFCKLEEDCKSKPPETQWRYVLSYCQKYQAIELDYFTGGHSR